MCEKNRQSMTCRLGIHLCEWEALQDSGESRGGKEAVCRLRRGLCGGGG